MSALAEDITKTLEPSGRGHELLMDWAPWVREDREDRHSWAVKPRIDPGYKGDMPRDVRIVDKIIAKQKLQSHADWRVVARFYLDKQEIWQVSRDLGWAEDRVRLRLLAVCGLVEREYRDWHDADRQ